MVMLKVLLTIINTVLKNVFNKRETSYETLEYYLLNNFKTDRFYFLPKIHQRFHNTP